MSLRFLLVLFSLKYLTQSVAVLLGALDEYEGLENCLEQAKTATHYSREDRVYMPEKTVNIGLKSIKNCVTEVAKNNTKVSQVKDQLITKMTGFFKFITTEESVCLSYLRPYALVKPCVKSMSLGHVWICNELWGHDGCMKKEYEEICGKGYSEKARVWYSFWMKKLEECEDKYFKT